MAETKAGKRSKPSYIYSIIGVSLVLFLFGIVGWMFLNLRKTGDYFKENIQVHAYMSRDAKKPQIDSVHEYIKALPYARKVEYVTKEKAIEKWQVENDTTWKQFLDNNPLPESIDFYVAADHVESDSLNLLASNLNSTFPGVISEFQFPQETVSKVSNFVKTAAIIFLALASVLTVLVIFSIDNTIRLAMYSNRFLIKTMQMVGATRNFIAKPFVNRAIINGLIAAIIAIGVLWVAIYLLESFIPDFKILHDNLGMFALFGIIIILGILITLVSTYSSVLKYLKLKLDDLY